MLPDSSELVLGVSDFVALLNQTLEFAYPTVTITGELANLRVSKNRWVYFDLKDENSGVKFFGTVYQLPGPLEDGMLLNVRGQPRLHNLYGFSVTVQSMQPAGEGSIRRAADLLKAKLETEGLFDESRKRSLPYPPRRIGLVTSRQSAAYADFVKVLGARWGGLNIDLIDVQVQGEIAPKQIVAALEQFNALAEPPEVIVVIRGGGSAQDLAAFSTEQVTRAVAASRVPTLVAIGHEIDLSLAELAADKRASTPSNAAELLVPDRSAALGDIQRYGLELEALTLTRLEGEREFQSRSSELVHERMQLLLQRRLQILTGREELLRAFDPAAILRRGYAIVRHDGKTLRSIKTAKTDDIVDIEIRDGRFKAIVSKEQHD